MKQLTALILAILVTLVFLVAGYVGAITLLYLWGNYGAAVVLPGVALLVVLLVLAGWWLVRRKR